MIFQRSSMRYAHTPGYTGVTYSEDGKYIITCGSDGDIRQYIGIDDDDPIPKVISEFVNAVVQKNGKLLVTTATNTIQDYTFPAMEQDGTLLRFTASATCLCVYNDYIAAGSEDSIIKVIKHGDIHKTVELMGHKAPILSIDISCNELLASIAGDGKLIIWNLDTGAEIKQIDGLPTTNSFEADCCFGTPSFEPLTGKSLAFAKGNQIYLLNTSTWAIQFTLSDEKIKGVYTCCRFSPNGQYIAAGTTKGEMSIFDFIRKHPLQCEPPSSNQSITCIAWNMKNLKELAFCDASGQLGTLSTQKLTNTNSNGELKDDVPCGLDEGTDDGLFGGDNYIDDVAEVDSNVNYDDDDVEDEDGAVSLEKLKRQVMQTTNRGNASIVSSDDEATKDSIVSSMPETVSTKLFQKQSSFQPGATPKNLENRFLVWNDVGIVSISMQKDTIESSINVQFHDASIHHGLHISNIHNYDMASLSTTVLILSAKGANKFTCVALAASGNKEWSIDLPDAEFVEAMTATNKLIGIITNMNFLRIFTVMGLQREIISLPGSVVAIAGHIDRLIVVYHQSAPSEKQQHLCAMLIETKGLQLRTQQITLPLPPERTMTWLGFTDCGSPAFNDNMGLVQIFIIKSNCWLPICDTRKHSQSIVNNYFVVTIFERRQIVQAILCRNCSYPLTTPQPIALELPMQLPLCDIESEKSELEDTLIRATTLEMDNTEQIITETGIKLFALACRREMESRARDIVETISSTSVLSLAIKYATKLGRIHLADRLTELMPHLEQNDEENFALIKNSNLSPFQQNDLNNTPTTNHNTSTNILAPKQMGLTHSAKRAFLKRTNIGLTPQNKTIVDDNDETLQENSPMTTDIESSDITNTDKKRLPLNSVNPFASKRKLADIDFGQKNILMGSEKLKLAKK